MDTDTLIIGGGLSGLSLAVHLEERGHSYQLIEARGRFGGRIKSQRTYHKNNFANFDLGPSWFWPGQPRIAALLEKFHLKAFHQYATGALTYEDEYGNVQRGKGFSSMKGSYRLTGSIAALIDSIVTRLPADRLHLNRRATKITKSNNIVATTIAGSEGSHHNTNSKRVVVTTPPRVAAETILFKPDLPKNAIKVMRDIPTWMAGHAKVLAVYEKPFWREAGLSGDAMSRRGPMVEIHDASPAEGGSYALFGFLGINAKTRKGKKDLILQECKAQFARLFGEHAKTPFEIFLQDWAFESETATPLDFTSDQSHPTYGLPKDLTNLWDGQLMLASTETATQFGGYLEGALEASEVAANNIITDAL